MSGSSEVDMSKVPDDILCEIINRLEVVEFICSGAVSTTWRRLAGRKYRNKTQIPWLMFSSRDKTEYRYFYSITEKKKYDIYLPDIGGRHCVGSSQGFLVSVDNNANLHARNPITGAHLLLPPTFNSPLFKGIVVDVDTGQIIKYAKVDYVPLEVSHVRKFHYKKVIFSPLKNIAVAIYIGLENPAFTRIGDDKWTALEVEVPVRLFTDAIFHKGRLHVINSVGIMAIFDDLDSSKHTLVSSSLDIEFILEISWYLVESPDGKDLYLVHKLIEDEDNPKTIDIRVYLLEKSNYTWNQTKTLGDVVLFLGYNQSMSLCAPDFSGLKKNSVYFTDDTHDFLLEPPCVGEMGVFNLEDGSIDQLSSSWT